MERRELKDSKELPDLLREMVKREFSRYFVSNGYTCIANEVGRK